MVLVSIKIFFRFFFKKLSFLVGSTWQVFRPKRDGLHCLHFLAFAHQKFKISWEFEISAFTISNTYKKQQQKEMLALSSPNKKGIISIGSELGLKFHFQTISQLFQNQVGIMNLAFQYQKSFFPLDFPYFLVVLLLFEQ